MVIGALGALDDVTVTQASAVWELRATDPTLSRRDLYRSGLRIGRDHIASTVNTLALAYAGAALPLLILLVVSRQSLGAVANSEVVAIEIVTTLVGSIGLVTAVPITTWLAAEIALERPHEPRAEVDPEPVPEIPRPTRGRRDPRRRVLDPLTGPTTHVPPARSSPEGRDLQRWYLVMERSKLVARTEIDHQILDLRVRSAR